MKVASNVRPSPIAGQWYSADPQRLADQVDYYVQSAHLPPLKGQVLAVMAPHAGHIYSGPVAGYAFAALRGLEPQVVVVVSPSHYPYLEPILTSAHSAYQTPLGLLPVDQEALQALNLYLTEKLGYGLAKVSNDPEHSLEIELPFLQRVLRQPFRLIPIMLREQSAHVAQGLGKSLARLFSPGGVCADQSYVLVASTDLSHFYPESVAETLDRNLLSLVEAFDPAGVIRADEEGTGFACGRGALAAVMWAARELGANKAQVLHYATSGAVTGDYGRVVGYGAAVFLRQTD